MAEPKRFLLVDDNPDDRALAERELRKEWPTAQFVHAGDLAGFQRALEEGNFSLCATDYQLRWSDGLATLRALRERFPSLPVIMFTGTGSEEVAVAGMKAGLTDYVLKSPQHYARLRSAARAALEREEALRRSQALGARLQSLLDRLNVGVFRAALDGRVLEANAACRRILGLGEGEPLGGPVLHQRATQPQSVVDAFASLREHGSAHDVELSLRRDGNALTHVALSLSRAERAFEEDEATVEGLIEDVTARKAAERELRRSSKLFRSVIDHVGDPMTLVSPEGEVVYQSPSSFQMLGYDPGELAGRITYDLVHPDDRPRQHAAFEALRAQPGLTQRFEYRVKHKDGSWRTVESVAQNLTDDPDIASVVIHSRDLTERRKLDEQVQHGQKMEAMGRLAGGVAHDFNNMLTAILTCSQSLLMTLPADSPVREEVAEIEQAGRRGAALTRQLLAFSRRQMLQPRRIDLNAVVRDMDHMLRRLIGEDLKLSTGLSNALPAVLADRGQLEQVLMNLVVNARDATLDKGSGGGEIRIETERVVLDDAEARTLEGLEPGPHVALRVSDSGTGMTDETRAHLFEPFFTTKDRGRGTGLGLSTLYGIVRQSGGGVRVQTQLGKGSTFEVLLPAEHLPAARLTPGAMMAASPRGSETLLVVEDEAVVREVTRRVLVKSGYRVLAASCGDEALGLCQRTQEKIDLLLTDVVMPGLSGPALAERVVALRPGIRVLFMSGYTGEALPTRPMEGAGTGFLQKPFTAEALLQAVREALDEERAAAGAAPPAG